MTCRPGTSSPAGYTRMSKAPSVIALTRAAMISAPPYRVSRLGGKLEASRQRTRLVVCTAGAPPSPPDEPPQPVIAAAAPTAAAPNRSLRLMPTSTGRCIAQGSVGLQSGVGGRERGPGRCRALPCVLVIGPLFSPQSARRMHGARAGACRSGSANYCGTTCGIRLRFDSAGSHVAGGDGDGPPCRAEHPPGGWRDGDGPPCRPQHPRGGWSGADGGPSRPQRPRGGWSGADGGPSRPQRPRGGWRDADGHRSASGSVCPLPTGPGTMAAEARGLRAPGSRLRPKAPVVRRRRSRTGLVPESGVRSPKPRNLDHEWVDHLLVALPRRRR